jgi:hypothetical protein
MKATESNNMWYFRDVTTVGADDDALSSIMLPVDQITGVTAGDTTSRIRIWFEQATSVQVWDRTRVQQNGFVELTITTGKQREVLQFLAEAANSSTHNTGYRTIADDATGEYAFRYITAVSTIHNT